VTWNAETNIKGPKGDKGDQGVPGPPGASGAGTGNVNGPAGAVADRIATYNGTSGTVIKDGGKLVSELALASHTHTASQITDFAEAVDDRTAALIQNGTGITWAYDDTAGTLTPTVSAAGGYTDEQVDDRVAALLVAGTNITLNYNDVANSLTINGTGGGGGGTAASVTFTPAGNLAATDVQAALVELDTEKVAKAGDVMTGNLQIGKANPSLILQKLASGQANQLAGYNGANARWSAALGDNTAESGSNNTGSDFALYRYNDAGTYIDAPLTVARTNGGTTLTGTLTLPNGTGALPSIVGAGFTTTGLAWSGSGLNLCAGGVSRVQISSSVIVSTLPFTGPNGAVSAPAYAFSGEASSGLYRKTTGSVSVSGANSEVMNWVGSTKTTTAFGPVLLPVGEPTAAQAAVPKAYVDSIVARNIIINGDFRINQGGYVSAAVLATTVYGHDQWKAGPLGGDYSFTQLATSTQITIASGKTLIQPIEDNRVIGGSYVLSWTGTAQARAGINTFVPSGAYAASPLLISGQTAGAAMAVEFNAGTLGTVKLESGSVATAFVVPAYASELVLCQRYFVRPAVVLPLAGFGNGAGYPMYVVWAAPVTMRTTPSAVASWSSLVNSTSSANTLMADNRTISSAITSSATGGFTGSYTVTSMSARL
jgi:hypothetical protein